MCWKKRIKQKRERERGSCPNARLFLRSVVETSSTFPVVCLLLSHFLLLFFLLSYLPFPLFYLPPSIELIEWTHLVDQLTGHIQKKKTKENGEIGRERQRWAGTRRNPCRPWRSSAKRMRMRRGSECAEGIRTGCSGWPIRASSSSPSASKTSSRASSSPTSSARRRQWNVTLNSTRKLSVSPF